MLVSIAVLAGAPQVLALSVDSATMPAVAKAVRVEALKLGAGARKASVLALEAADPAEIEAVRQANSASFHKKLQIGIGRDIVATKGQAGSAALQWTAVAGGLAAQWEVSSSGAHALRVGLAVRGLPAGAELRFAGRKDLGTVYGPFRPGDIAAGETYWSPVLEGDAAIVEVFVPTGTATSEVAMSVARLSHLFASPSDPAIESLAKASQSCEVDLICRSASDAALASTGKSVAKMTFSDGQGGGTYLCTGTLLNTTNSSFTPYFYSANHCMSTQASASTLTTHWFYDRTSCGSGSAGSGYTQLPGGATLLYANAAADSLLLRLNASPPAGAVFSGWDANTLSSGTALTAVHHPAGDFKKVSLATMGGFGSPFDSSTGFIISSWNSTATGVTEGGSSGSGIFTFNSGSGQYQLRGGLYGGPSSCTASGASLRDYYSRFDQVFPAISQYLAPTSGACSYSLSPTSVTVGAGATSGTLTVTTTSGCAWSATSNASWISSSSSGNGSGTVSYSVASNSGAARTGTLTIAGQSFTVSQQAPVTSSTNLVSNPGFETGTAGWSQSATGGYPIIYQDASVARAGSWYAWLGGYDSGTDTLYSSVTIPADATQASLRFWYYVATQESGSTAYDRMTVWIASQATGARLATLTTLSNADRTSGWVQSGSFDVSAFRGQTVWLVFTATTDSSNVTNFFVDDVSITATASGGGGTANYTALWLTPSEAGWGLNVVHQGDILFATLFTYDSSGRDLWLSMSSGTKQPNGSYAGTLYRTTGPAFNAVPFTSIGPSNYTTVGTMTLNFTSATTATLTYSVNGLPVVKNIVKYVYGATGYNCVGTTASRDSSTNYQDLWLTDNEAGWGVNVTHQDNTLFATLFTYDASGRDMWLVMSGGTRQPDGSYLGDLYRTTGPAFNAVPFTPITFPANYTTVGTMRFTFTSGTTGVMSYTVNGAPVTKLIRRFVFSSPVPICS
ncbi:MAG: hypothetical protein C3F16_08565 [Betaproteobacteria bacterium]|nr:MAG: hypothetical protein C3F16_08565 [Betaproteobacteria bacterium]